MRVRVEAAREAFTRLYGPGEVRLFFAPGRVNLIGEHTDYTGGYAFPAALTLGTWAALRPRKDGVFRLVSTRFAKGARFTRNEVRFRREEGWANFPKGMIRELAESGARLPGADILYFGDLPAGRRLVIFRLPRAGDGGGSLRFGRSKTDDVGLDSDGSAGGKPVYRGSVRDHGSLRLRDGQSGSRDFAPLPSVGISPCSLEPGGLPVVDHSHQQGT